MGARRPTYILAAGFLLSLGLHGTLLIPALVGVMNAGTGHDRLQARFSPEDFMRAEKEELPPEEEDQTKLGIDDGSPSTLTWIGYDQYEEHLAQLAEVEQAAFRDSIPGSDAPPAQSANQAPAEPKEAVDQEQADSQDAEDALAEIEQWLQSHWTGEGLPDPESPSMDLPEQQALAEALAKLEEIMNKQVEPVEQTEPQDQATPTEAPDQPAQPDAQPNEDDSPGDVAQKESDATSTIEVRMDQLRFGKPLAARGLEIMTHKPELTSLVMLTAAPANPRVELRFLRSGKPAKCRILESSGDPRIDEAILNSLYRWRARGKELTQLQRNETMPIRMRIIINARR